MNGRVYDPVLGRFLSADPNVDGVEDAQGYNRYSYVGNNPMNATDPSGYFSLKDALKIVAIVVATVVTAGAALYTIMPMLGTLGASYATLGAAIGAMFSGSLGLAGAIVAGAGAGFGASFAGSLLNGGSVGDAFKAGLLGAVVGGITAGITHGIGTLAEKGHWGWGKTALAHGAAQGGISEATGGEFRHGFYSGFFGSAAAEPISNTIGGGGPGQTVAAAIVGGTASAIGGGKFANGAISGAFTYLFNKLSHVATSRPIKFNSKNEADNKALGKMLNKLRLRNPRSGDFFRAKKSIDMIESEGELQVYVRFSDDPNMQRFGETEWHRTYDPATRRFEIDGVQITIYRKYSSDHIVTLAHEILHAAVMSAREVEMGGVFHQIHIRVQNEVADAFGYATTKFDDKGNYVEDWDLFIPK